MPIRDESQQENAGRQHPIPQNVMDVEFKVVGDLTVRQLMYLFAGGTLAYIFYKSELPVFWRLLLSFIAALTAIMVAFVPYQERGLDKWLVSFIKAMTMPTQMVWRKTYSPPAYFLSDYANIIKNEIITLTPAKSRNKLDDYLGQLSETQNELDKLESSRLQNIRMGFSNMATAGSSVVMQQNSVASSPSLGGGSGTETEVIYADEPTTPGRSFDTGESHEETHIERQPLPETIPEPEIPTKPTTVEKPNNNFNKQSQNNSQQSKPSQPIQTTQPKPIQQNKQINTQPNRQNQNIGRQQLQPQTPPSQQKTNNPPAQIQARKELMKNIHEDEMSSKKELMNSIEFKKPSLGAPSIDRAIINIPSDPNGEIKIKTTSKLPKTIVFQDIREIKSKESSLEKKVGELLEVTKQVRSEMQTAEDKEAHRNKNQGRIEYFNTKYQELEKERANITSQLDESSSQVQRFAPDENSELTKQVKDLSSKNEELKSQLAQIQSEIEMLRSATPTMTQPSQAQQTTIPTPQIPVEPADGNAMSLNKEAPVDANPVPTTTAQNVSPPLNKNIISGIVKDKTGAVVDNAVVIIKDKDGDAIRALKTNVAGQFKTQTSMQKGKYTVEVIKGGMKFDIISVEANDQPISPLSIIAFE